MENRRHFLKRVVAVSVFTGVAGCTGDNSTALTEDENDNQEPTETSTSEPESTDAPQSDSGTPEPENGWQEYLPHCSTGDFTFRVRGVRDSTVSIQNMGVESLEISTVSVVYGEVTSDQDIIDNGETIYTDVVIEGGNSHSFEFDGSYKPITRIGISTSAAERREESEDELCWGQP